MAGVITTGNHPKALWPGVAAWWGRTYPTLPKEYPDLFDMKTSRKSYEEDVEATGFGMAPVKTEGGSISYDSETQGSVSRYTNVAYALGYIVTYEEMRDNQYAEVSARRSEALMFSMNQTIETIAAAPYNRAFNSAFTGGDGVELLAANHPTVNGEQSNELNPSADFSEAALEDMVIQIMGAKNSRGLQLGLKPRKLIVPRQLWFESNRVLKSVLQNDTANNAVNALRTTNAIPEGICVNHYLTDADAFFVRTNAPRGMVGYEREPMTFDRENDFDTKNAKAAAYWRGVFKHTDFRGLYGSAGA